MAICPPLRLEAVLTEFNSLLRGLGCKPMEEVDVLKRDEWLNGLSKPEQDAYHRAYWLWNEYGGDLAKIRGHLDNEARILGQLKAPTTVGAAPPRKPPPVTPPAATTPPEPKPRPGEAGFATPDILGAKDIAAGASKVAFVIRSVKDDLLKIFNPAARGPEAKSAALMTREYAAQKQRSIDQVENALKDVRKFFDRLPEAKQHDFIDRMERGLAQPSADFDEVAQVFRQILDADRAEVQGLGTGKLAAFNEFYFPRYWEKGKIPPSASGRSKRPLEGSKAFLKKRSYQFFMDGINHGETPVSHNPADFVLWKHAEMQQYIAAHRILNEMKRTGLAEFSRGRAPYEGWTAPEDKAFTVWNIGDAGELIQRGKYYLPEEASRVINNYTSKGLRDKEWFRAYLTAGNLVNMMQLGFSGFHAGFVTLDAVISNNALALYQAAHGNPIKGISTLAKSPTAPILYLMEGRRLRQEWIESGRHPEMAPIVDAMISGGGRAQIDSFYKTETTRRMVQAFREGTLTGVAKGLLRVPFALAEQTSRPIMNWLVPNMKAGAISYMARYELERLGPNASREQVREAMAKVVDSIDNRMGQMIYDNLFFNKMAKDLGMASVRSLGWNLGDLREFGGGITDALAQGKKIAAGKMPELTQRMSYTILLPLTVGVLGGVLMYLLTGRRPKELKDYFYPQTGGTDENGDPERIQLPSYMRDIYPLLSQRDAKSTVKTGITMLSHKAHPLGATLIEMLENKDYYGTEILHPDDPLVMQAKEEAEHIGKTLLPFGFRGLQQERQRGASFFKQTLPEIGITPAPRTVNQTKAEQLLHEIQQEARPQGTRTKQEFERSRIKGEATRALARGDSGPMERARDAGILSDKDVKAVEEHSKESPIVRGFKQLPLKDALRVWDLANEKEREELRPLLEQKTKTLENVPENQREALTEKAGKALKMTREQIAETESISRHKVANATESERRLLVDRDRLHADTVKKLEENPAFDRLSDGQKTKARRELGSMFRSFGVSEDVQKLPEDQRNRQAERSLKILKSYEDKGVFDKGIEQILAKIKRAA